MNRSVAVLRPRRLHAPLRRSLPPDRRVFPRGVGIADEKHGALRGDERAVAGAVGRGFGARE